MCRDALLLLFIGAAYGQTSEKLAAGKTFRILFMSILAFIAILVCILYCALKRTRRKQTMYVISTPTPSTTTQSVPTQPTNTTALYEATFDHKNLKPLPIKMKVARQLSKQLPILPHDAQYDYHRHSIESSVWSVNSNLGSRYTDSTIGIPSLQSITVLEQGDTSTETDSYGRRTSSMSSDRDTWATRSTLESQARVNSQCTDKSIDSTELNRGTWATRSTIESQSAAYSLCTADSVYTVDSLSTIESQSNRPSIMESQSKAQSSSSPKCTVHNSVFKL